MFENMVRSTADFSAEEDAARYDADHEGSNIDMDEVCKYYGIDPEEEPVSEVDDVEEEWDYVSF